MIGKTRKIAPVFAFTLAMFLLLITAKPTMASKSVGSWEMNLPGDYEQIKQTFLRTFPEFEANNLYYRNPYLGPPEGPCATLTLDVKHLRAKAGEDNLHLKANDLELSVEFPLIPSLVEVQILKIAGADVELDIVLWEPDANGVFGELTAKFKGNVKFHIPEMPGLEPYHYEGPELNVKITFVEQSTM